MTFSETPTTTQGAGSLLEGNGGGRRTITTGRGTNQACTHRVQLIGVELSNVARIVVMIKNPLMVPSRATQRRRRAVKDVVKHRDEIFRVTNEVESNIHLSCWCDSTQGS